MMKKRLHSGFTFVEMTLAAAMVGVIAIALYAMIANGLKVWEIVNQESPQVDASLLFEKISMDLANGVCLEGSDFIGNEKGFSFSCISKTFIAENGFNQGVGRVNYAYDQGIKKINRQYVDYEQLSVKEQPEARNLISNISNILLSYYFFDEQKKAFLWSNVWPPEAYDNQDKNAWPLAVRVSMVFDIQGHIVQKGKTFNVPIGAIER
ncbi:MAG: hypothetical protein KKD05_01815 [Candidatus Omnitrophica bacterium]|nr:hypothetical protein [Candidatus Omnitrophota bacterium]